MNRELLLGYLMNALDDDEIGDVERELLRNSSLREELGRLRKELVPLSVASREEYTPPWGLAERTCARIWADVDCPSENFDGRSVPTISLNRFRMLDEILAVSPTVVESSSVAKKNGEATPVKPHPPRERSIQKISGDVRPGVVQGGWRLADLMASVAVGILIAVIAFPAINYARHRTETMVTQSRMKELGQAAGLYAQLEGPVEDEGESSNGIDLASSAWREVDPNRLPMLQVANGSRLAVDSPFGGSSSLFKTVSSNSPLIGERQGQPLYLNQETTVPTGKSYSAMLTDIEKAIPVSNGSSVQPAYGQNVLFQDGRIYFRVLPVFSK